MMDIFNTTLIMATLLCSLVAGFLLSFAIVVMPGIKDLNDAEFIRSFQVIDQVIQNNQPVFTFVWMGSILTLWASAILGSLILDHIKFSLILLATVIYTLSVQLPTFITNIPLNRNLQAVDTQFSSKEIIKDRRTMFESKWNRWNLHRTIAAILVSTLLISLLLQI